MGITRFLCPALICFLPLGCAAPPDEAARAYFVAESGETGFPVLLTGPELALANAAARPTFEEETLAARIAALRARAAVLNGRVLTPAEQALLRRGARR